MSRILRRFSLPQQSFILAAFAMFAGLVIRSCVPASEGILMPLCNGETMFLATGSDGMIHCAGCYVALFGFLGMISATVWGRVRRFI